MTDEPDEPLAPLSPADEARLRGLLADARETGPMPADVAARLDQVIAGLAAPAPAEDPHPATGSEATVLPLVRTRRHRVVAWLGAAAAVVVVGLGVGTFLDGSQQDADDAGGAADSSLVDRGAGEQEQPADAAPTGGQELDEGAVEDSVWIKRIDKGPAYDVDSRELTRDVARIRAAVLQPGTARYGKTTIYGPPSFTCPDAQWGRGILVAARYDGDPAYVAFRQPMGDSQVVEVLQCGTGALLRSTTLPTSPR